MLLSSFEVLEPKEDVLVLDLPKLFQMKADLLNLLWSWVPKPFLIVKPLEDS